MRIIGIDPAWSSQNPSAVVLIEGEQDDWRCTRLAPSAELFCRDESSVSSMFRRGVHGGRLDLGAILHETGEVSVIVVDMPLARDGNVYGTRAADRQVSRTFASAGCPTYTPNAKLHRELGDISNSVLAVADSNGYCFNDKLIETYPHPAILSLLNIQYRLPYKVNKRAHYWPDIHQPFELKSQLVENMLSLRNSIKNKIALPSEFTFDAGMPYSTLKIYEDILDALVCAWVGIEYLNNRCCRFGDDNTTIWIPEQW